MIEGEIISDRSIVKADEGTGIGGTNEAASSVIGIIIGEPLFYAVSNHLTRIRRTASL